MAMTGSGGTMSTYKEALYRVPADAPYRLTLEGSLRILRNCLEQNDLSTLSALIDWLEKENGPMPRWSFPWKMVGINKELLIQWRKGERLDILRDKLPQLEHLVGYLLGDRSKPPALAEE
jgi:hypothetical protein